PAVEEALFLLVQSYDALNMPELRKDAERVMRQNFPNSRYYAGKGTEAEPQAWWKLW
ncbi:MAG: outer membrane protein assembly factor BamD, partial [Zoogloea sp.]|nr:outer membrane protein assembly factor BamD [Zoogloea sp.]